MERTIRVTGKGQISLKPDLMRLHITQSAVKDGYEDSINESAEQKEYLNCEIVKLGFKKEDLKTLSFDIDANYEGYHDKNGNWKRKFKGYKFTHSMKIEFPVDNSKLGELLAIVARCPGKPDFSIEFTVSDSESAKNTLLAKAIEDSKAKAMILTQAAGVILKDIINIDYSWGKIDIVSRPINKLSAEEDALDAIFKVAPQKLDIESDDIKVSDSVTVIWRIE